MESIRDRVGRASPGAIAWAGALATGLPLLGLLPAQGVLDLVLLGVAGLGAAGGGWAWRERRRLEALPLELSSVALRDLVDGLPAVKVRARLGRGRVARDPEAEVVWVDGDGEHALPVVTPAPVVSGAFTFLAFDRAGLTSGAGTLRVRARVRAGAATWEAERAFERLEEGRFAPPVVRERGRLRHDRSGWERVQA